MRAFAQNVECYKIQKKNGIGGQGGNIAVAFPNVKTNRSGPEASLKARKREPTHANIPSTAGMQIIN